MKEDRRAECKVWGETKQRVNIMLTPKARLLIKFAAEEAETSQSEIIEWAIRLVHEPGYLPFSEGTPSVRDLLDRLKEIELFHTGPLEDRPAKEEPTVPKEVQTHRNEVEADSDVALES
jgi:hypothetical protein